MILRCSGPGPHDPVDGVLGEADHEVEGMLCNSPACQPAPPPATIDPAALRSTVSKATTVTQLRGAMLAYLDAVAADQP